MKKRSYRMVALSFYFGIMGLTLFMYNLRWEKHTSPWSLLYLSSSEINRLSNFGDNAVSAKSIGSELVNSQEVRKMLQERSGQLAPIIIKQLRGASKQCVSDFGSLDSLLSGSDPHRLIKFVDYLLTLAGPIATKERLDSERVRLSFFPKSVKTLNQPEDIAPRLFIDFVKSHNEDNDSVKSIQGVSTFLVSSSLCSTDIEVPADSDGLVN